MTHSGRHHASDSTPDRTDELVSRLAAVERTLTGTDTDVSALEDVAALEARISDLESTVETIADRLDEVDAATQAMRGYVGGVRTVNEDVERRANAALAKAESLEDALVDESTPNLGSGQMEPTDAEATTTNGPEATPRHNRAPTSEHDGFEAPTHTDARPPRRSGADQTTDETGRGLAARLRDAL
ncbi:hypothetical protein [Haloferax sp. YSMS24]|uniref:DUF7310 family coiled-coil domain-containing protein n=1 Tax=Haloferax sp. YSMS24 TaxID=3388425 RepID=UPI00398CEDF7